jgi:hypothetical protein
MTERKARSGTDEAEELLSKFYNLTAGYSSSPKPSDDLDAGKAANGDRHKAVSGQF